MGYFICGEPGLRGQQNCGDLFRNQGLVFKNNILYVANYNTKLVTYDVTDRANPILIDTKNFTSGYGPVDVQVFDNYLYVSIRYSGIRIYDISKKIPLLVGSQKTSTGYSEQISSNGQVTTMSRWTSGQEYIIRQ